MIIKNDKVIADTFNNYFANITKTLKLKKHPNFDGQSLSVNKTSPIEDILIKILKNSVHIYSEKLTNVFNERLINGKFPDTLTRADVTPIFKKGNDNEKKNYDPESMLSTFSKVFEKLVFEQINDHMQSKFSKHLTGFCKKPQYSKCFTGYD